MNTSPKNEARPPIWAGILIDLSAVTMVLAVCTWAAISAYQQPPSAAGAAFEAPRSLIPCMLNSAGYLSGRLYGTLDQNIEWHGAEMTCDGMVRPNNKGIRLMFALPEESADRRLVFVIGIDGEIERLVQREERANVTIIDEGAGRFFSTGGRDRCWTTVQSIEELEDINAGTYQVNGELYCAGALPSLNGKGSVTLGDFSYSGRLSLDDS